MKAIILSGFLGAGKTSLLLQLATYLTSLGTDSNPTRVAILENEIGRVGVDGNTLRSQGIEVTELFAGCVCCNLSVELQRSVFEINEFFNPDWLILETTGLAFPDKVAESVSDAIPGLEGKLVLVIADAHRFLALEKVSPLATGQVERADALLLNKVDLVDAKQVAAVRQRLGEINPHAPIIQAVAAEPLPPEVFADVLAHV